MKTRMALFSTVAAFNSHWYASAQVEPSVEDIKQSDFYLSEQILTEARNDPKRLVELWLGSGLTTDVSRDAIEVSGVLGRSKLHLFFAVVRDGFERWCKANSGFVSYNKPLDWKEIRTTYTYRLAQMPSKSVSEGGGTCKNSQETAIAVFTYGYKFKSHHKAWEREDKYFTKVSTKSVEVLQEKSAHEAWLASNGPTGKIRTRNGNTYNVLRFGGYKKRDPWVFYEHENLAYHEIESFQEIRFGDNKRVEVVLAGAPGKIFEDIQYSFQKGRRGRFRARAEIDDILAAVIEDPLTGEIYQHTFLFDELVGIKIDQPVDASHAEPAQQIEPTFDFFRADRSVTFDNALRAEVEALEEDGRERRWLNFITPEFKIPNHIWRNVISRLEKDKSRQWTPEGHIRAVQAERDHKLIAAGNYPIDEFATPLAYLYLLQGVKSDFDR